MTHPATISVDDLVSRFHELGLTELDLDESVRDAANALASNQVNDNEPTPDVADDAFEHFHDLADEAAAEINNGGCQAQLTYLIEQWGAAEVWTHLVDLT